MRINNVIKTRLRLLYKLLPHTKMLSTPPNDCLLLQFQDYVPVEIRVTSSMQAHRYTSLKLHGQIQAHSKLPNFEGCIA